MSRTGICDINPPSRASQSSWSREGNDLRGSVKKFLALLLLAVFIGLGIGGAIFSAYKWLGKSEFFQITSIKIDGARRLDKRHIQEISGVDIHTNLMAMDVSLVKEKLESHPWVEWAVVKRELPSNLVISVKERRPLALLNGADGLYYLDRKARPFVAVGLHEELDFPVITGLEGLETGPGGVLLPDEKERLAIKQALAFIGYASRGRAALPRQNISEIHIGEQGEFTLFLADHPFPVHLGKEVGKKKYNQLAKVLYWLYKKKEFPDVNYIRMDYVDEAKVLVGKS